MINIHHGIFELDAQKLAAQAGTDTFGRMILSDTLAAMRERSMSKISTASGGVVTTEQKPATPRSSFLDELKKADEEESSAQQRIRDRLGQRERNGEEKTD
jgi:hypothetical protein